MGQAQVIACERRDVQAVRSLVQQTIVAMQQLMAEHPSSRRLQ
jgi:hypothetical protein